MGNKPLAKSIAVRSDISSRENDGWGAEQVNNLQFNQALYQQTTDHVWGTLAQTIAGTADIWTDGSGDAFDKDATPIVFQDQDKILIGIDTQATANLLLRCGQKRITIEMLSGIQLDMDTFDLTIGESGDSFYGSLDITGTGGEAIIYNPLDLVMINSGMLITNVGGWFSEPSQLFSEPDKVVVLQANITNYNNEDKFVYWDTGSSVFKRRDGTTVALSNDLRIEILGLDTLTAIFDQSAFTGLKVESVPGLVLGNSSFDLQFGDNTNLDLTVSDSAKVLTGVDSRGFINDLNINGDARPIINGLVCKYASDTTISVDIASFKWKRFLKTLSTTWDSAGGVGLNAWDDSGSALTTSKSEHFIWLLMNSTTGALATVAGYNKTVPLITDAAFDGYEVVTLLTHFIVDGSGNILPFVKRGNKWNYLEATGDGFGLSTGSAIVTSALQQDITLAVPLIGEIEGVSGIANLISSPGAQYHREVAIGYQSNLSVSPGSIMNGSTILDQANDGNRGYWAEFEFAYIQQYMYTGTSGGTAQHTFAVLGCRYNNIQGG